mgnify:CR=1 FL=1
MYKESKNTLWSFGDIFVIIIADKFVNDLAYPIESVFDSGEEITLLITT